LKGIFAKKLTGTTLPVLYRQKVGIWIHDFDIWIPAVLRIRDVYSGSLILIFTHPGSRISDPKTATKERGEKNLLSYLFM
jgi:hypothetical protein